MAKTLTREELDEMLSLHVQWCKDHAAGKRANLSDTELATVDLQRANLQGANLQRAYLEGANLQGASLQGASLQGANLQEANLQRADFRGTNLDNVDFRRANLIGALLSGAVNIPACLAACLDSHMSFKPVAGPVAAVVRQPRRIHIVNRIPAETKGVVDD